MGPDRWGGEGEGNHKGCPYTSAMVGRLGRLRVDAPVTRGGPAATGIRGANVSSRGRGVKVS